ncbi:MAG: hypothetical protein ACQEXX_01505 [Bacillota bacterium]
MNLCNGTGAIGNAVDIMDFCPCPGCDACEGEEIDEDFPLLDSEIKEYVDILTHYPICHDDCIEILKFAARLKSIGFSNQKIIERMMWKPLNGLGTKDLTKEFE